MSLISWLNADTWDVLRDKVNAIVTLLNGKVTDKQSSLTETAYVDADVIVSYTTPNDGTTRNYVIQYSGYVISNSVAISGGAKLTIDGVDIINQIAVDPGTTSRQIIHILWYAAIGPNKVIAIKARLNNANKNGNNVLIVKEA